MAAIAACQARPLALTGTGNELPVSPRENESCCELLR